MSAMKLKTNASGTNSEYFASLKTRSLMSEKSEQLYTYSVKNAFSVSPVMVLINPITNALSPITT